MYLIQSVIQALALPLQWMDNSPTPSRYIARR